MSVSAAPVLALAMVVSLTDLVSPFLQPGSREARQALERYREGEWVEAIETLQGALEAREDPVLSYNLGAAAYKGQNYPEAMEAYNRAAGSETVPAERVAYDRGNVQVKAGDPQGALESYRAALRANPDDEDARYNYEVVLRQMQGQDQEQDQQEQGDQGQNQEPEQGDAPQDSTGQSQGDQEQSGEQGRDQPQPQPGQGEEEQQQEPSRGSGEDEEQTEAGKGQGEAKPEGQLLTPEQAQRLLNAITPEERELLEARLKSAKRRRVEKDW